MNKKQLIDYLIKVKKYQRLALKYSTNLQIIKIATKEGITAVLNLI